MNSSTLIQNSPAPQMPLAKSLFEGLASAWVATEALDWLSVVLYEAQTQAERDTENQARNHLQAYEVAVSKICDRFGIELSREELGIWGWRFHKSVGLGAGLLYAMLRRKYKVLGLGYGLAFGAFFFVVVDEILTPLTGLSPGPKAYSWKVHARGAVAHIAYGIAAECALRTVERIEAAQHSGQQSAQHSGQQSTQA